MIAIGELGSPLLFAVAFALNLLVLLYRFPRAPGVRRGVDRLWRALTGDGDWNRLRLWHLLLPLTALTVGNIAWNLATVHCSEDSFAILASGQAFLHGQNPFLINFCGSTGGEQIPYGLAEVLLNGLGATAGAVFGVWIVWQALALAVVPLVWFVAGPDHRYVSVLVATSVLYLPNIATNIGVENAVVPVSVLLMLYAMTIPGGKGGAWKGVSAFLSTARFPAVFPLLGSSAPMRRGRAVQLAIVLGVFLGCALASYLAWGWSAIEIVYVGQFSRVPAESLNLFALLLTQGWVHPSLATAAVQGAGLLALVGVVQWRRYSAPAACALPLLGVFFFTQYLSFHFVLWIVPLLLLGDRIRWAVLAFSALAFVDETYVLWYVAEVRNVWWPYELFGVLLAALLVAMIVQIVRDEEARRTAPDAAPPAAVATAL
jgi:hypothetical protein